MNSRSARNSGRRPSPEEPAGIRPVLKWTVVGVLGLCVVLVAWQRWQSRSPAVETATVNSSVATNASAVRKPVVRTPVAVEPNREVAAPQPDPATGSQPAVADVPVPVPANPPAVAAGPVDPSLEAMVTGLKQLSGTNVALTAEAVNAWRTNLAQLTQAGPAAVPALKAFLDQNVDYAFSKEAWQTLGYPSARIAAFETLRQIGGPEALAVLEQTLGETGVPREIAVLAKNLEESSPGQYREQSLARVREALAAAAAAKDAQVDVAPLFEVFQKYGDASVIPDLEKAMGQWKYYAAMALVNLPEGAGIPSILRMADPSASSGNRLIALETVAQLAAGNPDIRNFLVQQAQANQIPARYWPYLTGPLSGDQYYPMDSAITHYPALQTWSDLKTTRIPYGNQNLYSLPGTQTLTPDGISQRLAVVDELLKVAADPAAVQALQQARNKLDQRSTRMAQVPGTTGAPGAKP